MHRALSPAMFTECMFVSVEASPTAKDRTMVLFFVNCRGDLSSEKMLFDFSRPNLQQSPTFWDVCVLELGYIFLDDVSRGSSAHCSEKGGWFSVRVSKTRQYQVNFLV